MWNFTTDTTIPSTHPTLQFAAKYMVEKLLAEGLPARLWEHHVVFGVAECWGHCSGARIRPGHNTWVTSLGFDFFTDRGKTYIVSDIIAGVGETPQQSMETAAENYLSNVFEAFHCMHDPGRISEETKPMRLKSYSALYQRETQWDIFQGGGLVTAGVDTVGPLLQTLLKPPPLSLILNEVTGLLAADRSLHWIKIFGCRQPTGQIINECALDNQPSAAANRSLGQFRWPQSVALQSFRQFYVLRPRS